MDAPEVQNIGVSLQKILEPNAQLAIVRLGKIGGLILLGNRGWFVSQLATSGKSSESAIFGTNFETNTTSLGVSLIVSVQEARTEGGTVDRADRANVRAVEGTDNVRANTLLLVSLKPVLKTKGEERKISKGTDLEIALAASVRYWACQQVQRHSKHIWAYNDQYRARFARGTPNERARRRRSAFGPRAI